MPYINGLPTEFCEIGENAMWLFFLEAIGKYVRSIDDFTKSVDAGLDASARLASPIATDLM